ERPLTRSGGYVGTLDYSAPEQIRGEPNGPGGDVYALACVLFECLTGAVPYPRENDAATPYAHLSHPPPQVSPPPRHPQPPLLAGAVAAGVLLGLARPHVAAAQARTFERAGVGVTAPPGWHPVVSAAVPGLVLDRPVTLGRGVQRLLAGRLAAPGDDVLPA